jgi:hypothetical protein
MRPIATQSALVVAMFLTASAAAQGSTARLGSSDERKQSYPSWDRRNATKVQSMIAASSATLDGIPNADGSCDRESL